MNISFLSEYDSDGRYIDNGRGLDDSRLLDAAETLVTLQTSDLGSEILVFQGLVAHVHQSPPVAGLVLCLLGAVNSMLLSIHLDLDVAREIVERHVAAKCKHWVMWG